MACFTKIFHKNKGFNPSPSDLADNKKKNETSTITKKQNLNNETGRYIFLSEESFSYTQTESIIDKKDQLELPKEQNHQNSTQPITTILPKSKIQNQTQTQTETETETEKNHTKIKTTSNSNNILGKQQKNVHNLNNMKIEDGKEKENDEEKQQILTNNKMLNPKTITTDKVKNHHNPEKRIKKKEISENNSNELKSSVNNDKKGEIKKHKKRKEISSPTTNKEQSNSEKVLDNFDILPQKTKENQHKNEIQTPINHDDDVHDKSLKILNQIKSKTKFPITNNFDVDHNTGKSTVQDLIENSVGNLPMLEAQIGNEDYEERRRNQIPPHYGIPKIAAPCYLEELKMLQQQQQQQQQQQHINIKLQSSKNDDYQYRTHQYYPKSEKEISKNFVTKKTEEYEKLNQTPATKTPQKVSTFDTTITTDIEKDLSNKIIGNDNKNWENIHKNSNLINDILPTTTLPPSSSSSPSFLDTRKKTNSTISNNNNQTNDIVLQKHNSSTLAETKKKSYENQDEKSRNSNRKSSNKIYNEYNNKKQSTTSQDNIFEKKSTASILQYEEKMTQEVSRKEGLIFKRPQLTDTKQQIIIPIHEKDEKTSKLIMKAIENNDFLNNYMDEERKKRVIDAMEPAIYDKGKFIIRENEEGSEIYVSEDGVFEVIKNNEIINTLGSGIVFGELAILYNAKRFASIRAASKAKVWKIDRSKFRTIMLISGSKENEENLAFLKTSPLNKDLPEEILKKVTDLLVRRFFPTNTCILRQGDYGDDFYIIRGGTVTIKKTNELGEQRKVNRLKRGDYFGEQALLNTDVRQASVYADAPGTECLILDRVHFISYLGTIRELKEKPIDYDIVPEINPSILNTPYDHIELKDLKKMTTLGAGAFGRVDLVVYEANKSFALKIIKKIDIIKQGQIDHIYNEKLVMSMCHRSPFIVELYKTYRDSKYVYFLMEVCLGGDVWTIMYQKKSFDEKTAKFISACVVEAFNFLHSRNIIFRDLKPENLMLTTDGYCKLVDFGFAKRLSPNYKTNTFAGTPEYVAPEIILDRGHDRSVDYWALGILIYELLVGRTPFRGQNQMKIYQHILGGIDAIKMPSRIPRIAQGLIKNLCRQLPAERLGYQRKGIVDIKKHSWYDGFDWNKLQNQTMNSPIKRPINSITDTQHFPTKFELDNDVPPDDFSGWDINF